MKAIVCVDKNWGIGKNNDLLFHFKEDMRHFKEHTLGNVVVMGSNTLISFPDSKPLPGKNYFQNLAEKESFRIPERKKRWISLE